MSIVAQRARSSTTAKWKDVGRPDPSLLSTPCDSTPEIEVDVLMPQAMFRLLEMKVIRRRELESHNQAHSHIADDGHHGPKICPRHRRKMKKYRSGLEVMMNEGTISVSVSWIHALLFCEASSKLMDGTRERSYYMRSRSDQPLCASHKRFHT